MYLCASLTIIEKCKNAFGYGFQALIENGDTSPEGRLAIFCAIFFILSWINVRRNSPEINRASYECFALHPSSSVLN